VAASILIVEDSALATDAFTLLLEEAGYTVHSARTVADATRRGLENSIDLMLLDLTLPDGSGLEVIGALRKAGRVPRATLAMTGHTDPELRQQCLDAGCADVMVKPVPIRELLRQISRLLD
jgi:DNA-binding response OmpR family regulator